MAAVGGGNVGELVAMLYTSRAVQPLDRDQVFRLLHEARIRNAALGITGVLLHRHGEFMQYLEGPPSAVARIYARITRDRRHTEVRLQLHQSLTHRAFERWSMGYATSQQDSLPERLHDVLERFGAHPRARAALGDFWQPPVSAG